MLVHDRLPPRRPARIGEQHHCLVLHGLGDSKEGWKPAAPLFGLDELGFVFANAPDFYFGGWSWFDLDQDMRPDEDGIRRSRGLLAELIDQLLDDLCIPAERLFLLGFSQGCVMVLDAALRSQHRFAGAVAISGWLAFDREYPGAFGPFARATPILWTHGTHDPMIPITAPRRQQAALAALGVDVTWREYAKEHSLDPDHEVADIAGWLAARMSG